MPFRLLRRASAGAEPAITPVEAELLGAHSAMMGAALAGWFVCALFASVAYGWTFYYLLALAIAPREILIDRLRPSPRSERARRAAFVQVTAR